MSALTLLATYPTRVEAEIAAGLLADAGIPHMIESSEGMPYSPLLSGARLLVREDHLPWALRVLGFPRLVQDPGP